MDDPQVVMAAATVASTLVALAAFVLSLVGLLRSNSALKDAQIARENATSAQWKMAEHLEAIAEAQAQAAKAGETAGRLGGRLSARLEMTGRTQRLIIANVGAQPVTIRDIEVEPAGILFGGDTNDVREGLVGEELDPGQHFSIAVAITLGTEWPIRIKTRWHDNLGDHEREQKIMP